MGLARLLVFWCLAILAAYSDFRWRRVPDPLVLAGLAAGACFAAWGGRSAIMAAASFLALGFALLLPAFLVGGVGGGDVKSLALIGLFAGPSLLLSSFFWGAMAGGVAGGTLILIRRLKRRRGDLTPGGEGRRHTLPYAGIIIMAAAAVMTMSHCS